MSDFFGTRALNFGFAPTPECSCGPLGYDTNILADYVLGLLNPEQESAVEEHLKTCPECRIIVEEQKGLLRIDHDTNCFFLEGGEDNGQPWRGRYREK